MSSQSDRAMKAYYQARAPIYDDVYEYPERQQNLRTLETYVRNAFATKSVIEIAAGTGYWSQYITELADSLLATDSTREALAQIAERPLGAEVNTQIVDAYALHGLDYQFDAAFAGLWLSHVPKQKLAEFLSGLHSCLKSGSKVLFIDNSIRQTDRLPISHVDEYGNSFQLRTLADGRSYSVLKNFPSERELNQMIANIGCKRHYQQLEHFWLFEYQVL